MKKDLVLTGIVKICSECGVEKDLCEFGYYNGTKNYQCVCKKCRKVKLYYNYYNKNKDKIKSIKRLKYVGENKDIVRQRNRDWYNKNKEDVQIRAKKYRGQNKERYKEMMRYYDKKRTENGDRAKYQKERLFNNVEIKTISSIRNRINNVLNRVNCRKTNKTLILIGCSVEFLKQHLESQFIENMSWENHKRNGWHIDHIIPCSYFDLTKEENQKICFNYRNLQPLWGGVNINKSDKLPENYLEIIENIKQNLK